MSWIAVPVLCRSMESAKESLERLVLAGADIVELRLDYLPQPDEQKVRLLVGEGKKSGLKVLATCRSRQEGGHFEGDVRMAIALLRAAADSGADFVDVELNWKKSESGEFGKLLREYESKCIVSMHDFHQLPENVTKIQNELREFGHVSKIAYMPADICQTFDALDMMRTEVQLGRDVIAMAMGERGMISRLLAGKLGVLLTFASLDGNSASAPGQVTIGAMKKTFRWEHLGPSTKLLGVIACPVSHSLSPLVHNAAYDATGYDGLYLPLLVEGGSSGFKSFMDNVLKRPWLDFRGFSVTLPHKENALKYLHRKGGIVEPLAEKIGAVNTLLIDENGKLHGYNKDYAGALDAITDALGCQRTDLRGMRAGILGAGGVSRALVAGLRDAGAEVIIYNRTVEKARMLAEEFRSSWSGLEGFGQVELQLVVNGTSVGMAPDVEDCPVIPGTIQKEMVVFDTIYNPLETKLLRYAKEAGAKTIDGASMFVRQAVCQFELFTGIAAPRELMDRVLRGELVSAEKR